MVNPTADNLLHFLILLGTDKQVLALGAPLHLEKLVEFQNSAFATEVAF